MPKKDNFRVCRTRMLKTGSSIISQPLQCFQYTSPILIFNGIFSTRLSGNLWLFSVSQKSLQKHVQNLLDFNARKPTFWNLWRYNAQTLSVSQKVQKNDSQNIDSCTSVTFTTISWGALNSTIFSLFSYLCDG